MTQPAEAAALEAVAPDTSTPQPAPVPAKQLSPKELADEIKAEANVATADLRKLTRFQWGDMVWEWGKYSPVNKAYVVMAMFHAADADEVRAYAAPVEKGPYICYVIRKDAPAYGVESMSLATFRESVVDELNALEADASPRDIGRDEGRAECVEYIRQLAANGGLDTSGAALTLEQIAQKLEDEADVSDDGGEGV